jgi:pilus assembly protein FimV
VSFRRDKALQAAQQHAARGDLSAAVGAYQSVVEHQPNDAPTWVLLADTLHRAGDVHAAVDRYVHAANLLFESDELPNALQIYRQALNLAPERYDIHLRTAQAFEQLRRHPEAVALYEKVAGVYLRSGNTREALLLYERVADLMPREIAKRLRLAELFSRERRVDDAVRHFHASAHFLRQAGRTEEYVRVAERLLYHRPLDEVTRELVRVYLELNQPRRALMKLNELLQRQNNDPDGLELLADTFVRMGKVDKACSVVLELVKHQRDAGQAGIHISVRVLRKAVTWAPQNQKLKKALEDLGDVASPAPPSRPAPPATPDQTDEIEDLEELEEFEEFEEFEELEDDDETSAKAQPVAPEPERAPQPPRPPRRDSSGMSDGVVRPRRHSLTQDVISEGTQGSSEDAEFDTDKQLEEIRVLMKYHLFEHALGHAEQILAASPNHAQGMELSAEILAALGRNDDAADARAKLAAQLINRDPASAVRHVELALALIPNHPLASELGERLSEMSGVDVGVADVDDAGPREDDPLGALDLDDDLLGPIEASDSLIGDVETLASQSLNRGNASDFGRRDHHVEAANLDDDPHEHSEDSGIDIRSADPALYGQLNELAGDNSDFAISLDHGLDPGAQPESQAEIRFEDRFGLGSDDDDDEPVLGDTDDHLNEETLSEVPPPIIGRIEPDEDADDRDEDNPFGDDDDEPEPEPEPEPESEPESESFGVPQDDDEPEPEPEEWLDLSAELEELEFYFAQDLEEDALAAYNDLVELFPGHPELAKIAHRFPDAAGVEVDAAAPLLDLEDEDEDEADFLAGIFDDAAPKQRKQREVAIQTHEVTDADASDHFDLGTAYREMGLHDKSFAEYELAARDPRWQAKALVMMGNLKLQGGDLEASVELFGQAVEAARTKDERCEANYEFAMVSLAIGEFDQAKSALEQVEPGYRDRDARLEELS